MSSLIFTKNKMGLEPVDDPQYDVSTSLGSEIVTEGDFATGATWSFGTGWSLTSSQARAGVSTTAGVLSQAYTFDITKLHRFSFDVIDVASYTWELLIEVGGFSKNIAGAIPSQGDRTHIFEFYPTIASSSISFTAWTDGSTQFAIDNVSLKEATAIQTISTQQWGTKGILPDKGNFTGYTPEPTGEREIANIFLGG